MFLKYEIQQILYLSRYLCVSTIKPNIPLAHKKSLRFCLLLWSSFHSPRNRSLANTKLIKVTKIRADFILEIFEIYTYLSFPSKLDKCQLSTEFSLTKLELML